MKKRRIALFGSTGSIGRSTLDVVRHLPDRFEVCCLAADSSVKRICDQAREFQPQQVILSDRDACAAARRRLGPEFDVLWGPGPLLDAAASRSTDIVVMAMSGTSGLLATIAALEKGKRLAIATKEILVGFGEHLVRTARRQHAQLLPIDSELAAVHQCLAGRSPEEVSRVILTASGGPFWRWGLPYHASKRDVLAHPTWTMGAKITVDSATLMNKGLEVIETCRLLGLGPDRVEAVIHPQSIIHSLVEFVDGSVSAQLAHPDMRLPIQYCLTYPDRLPSLCQHLELSKVTRLDFRQIDPERFPCYMLARRAIAAGGLLPCVLNTANQAAVEFFLKGRIAFGAIPDIIEATMSALAAGKRPPHPSVPTLLETESWALSHARELARKQSRPCSKDVK